MRLQFGIHFQLGAHFPTDIFTLSLELLLEFNTNQFMTVEHASYCEERIVMITFLLMDRLRKLQIFVMDASIYNKLDHSSNVADGI